MPLFKQSYNEPHMIKLSKQISYIQICRGNFVRIMQIKCVFKFIGHFTDRRTDQQTQRAALLHMLCEEKKKVWKHLESSPNMDRLNSKRKNVKNWSSFCNFLKFPFVFSFSAKKYCLSNKNHLAKQMKNQGLEHPLAFQLTK